MSIIEPWWIWVNTSGQFNNTCLCKQPTTTEAKKVSYVMGYYLHIRTGKSETSRCVTQHPAKVSRNNTDWRAINYPHTNQSNSIIFEVSLHIVVWIREMQYVLCSENRCSLKLLVLYRCGMKPCNHTWGFAECNLSHRYRMMIKEKFGVALRCTGFPSLSAINKVLNVAMKGDLAIISRRVGTVNLLQTMECISS